MYVQKLSKLGTIATIRLEFGQYLCGDSQKHLYLWKFYRKVVWISSNTCRISIFQKNVPILPKSGIFCSNLFKIRPVPIKQKPTIKIF